MRSAFLRAVGPSLSRYRKIEVRMWGDKKFRNFDDQTKLLWCYLLSGPETTQIPGVLTVGEAGLAEALGWEIKQFRNRFETVSKASLACSDWGSRIVFLPNAIKYNPPANGNIVKGWADAIKELPESHLIPIIISKIHYELNDLDQSSDPKTAYSELFCKRLGNRFETVSKPTRIQEQEQEQEQDNKQKTVPADAAPSALVLAEKKGKLAKRHKKAKSTPIAEITDERAIAVVDHYMTYHPTIRVLGEKTLLGLFGRLDDDKFTVDELKSAIDGNHKDEWHLNNSQNGLELIVRDAEHVQKFIRYNQSPPRPQASYAPNKRTQAMLDADRYTDNYNLSLMQGRDPFDRAIEDGEVHDA